MNTYKIRFSDSLARNEIEYGFNIESGVDDTTLWQIVTRVLALSSSYVLFVNKDKNGQDEYCIVNTRPWRGGTMYCEMVMTAERIEQYAIYVNRTSVATHTGLNNAQNGVVEVIKNTLSGKNVTAIEIHEDGIFIAAGEYRFEFYVVSTTTGKRMPLNISMNVNFEKIPF